MNQVKQGINL